MPSSYSTYFYSQSQKCQSTVTLLYSEILCFGTDPIKILQCKFYSMQFFPGFWLVENT